ncbi:MAG: BON domain-containing protein, partial [Pseudomonadota bacterium]
MRKILGGVVLIAGVAALGFWGRAEHAREIEDQISASANALPAIAESAHGLQPEVSGRDIVLSGIVDNAAERAQIIAALDAVPGRRVVVDQLTVLPFADPYQFEVVKTSVGTRVAGVAPTVAVQAQLVEQAGAVPEDVILSAGMPDDAWPEVVGQGLTALGALNEGTMRVTGRELSIVGVAASPDAKAQAIAAITRLPSLYNGTDEIELLDDGTPFRLIVDYDGTVATATGKLPLNNDPATILSALDATLDTEGVVIAEIPPEGSVWPRIAHDGAAALAALDQGRLTINDTSIELIGVAGSAISRQTAEGLIDGLESVAVTEHRISFADDGRPFQMVAIYGGRNDVEASGKLPAGLDPETLAEAFGTPFATDDFERALIDDPDGVWAQMATDLMRALSQLEIGRLDITDRNARLTGVANSRAAKAAVDELLADLPEGVAVTEEISFADDGRPFSLDVDANNGVIRASGKFPANIDVQRLSDSLGRRLPM